jgi:hypothetical protein
LLSLSHGWLSNGHDKAIFRPIRANHYDLHKSPMRVVYTPDLTCAYNQA